MAKTAKIQLHEGADPEFLIEGIQLLKEAVGSNSIPGFQSSNPDRKTGRKKNKEAFQKRRPKALFRKTNSWFI